MATGNSKGKKSAGKSGGRGGVQFIDVRLSEDDKDRIQESLSSGNITFDAIFDLLEEGYKFGLRRDERNYTYVATLTDQRTTPTRVLSGRGSIPINSIASLLYRHLVLLGGDWEANGADARNTDFD